MNLPAILLGFVIASLYGAVFHLWRGGSLRRLLLYLVFSWAGFLVGHLLGEWLAWRFLAVGPLNLGMATLGSLLFLGVGYWLSLVEIKKA